MNFEYISVRGDVLQLINNKKLKLVNIDNQTAASSKIASVIIAGSDGDTVNSIQAQPRSLVLDLKILDEDIERTKREILSVIKLKQQGTIRWEQADKVVEIKGAVESIEMPRWNDNVTMQVTLHCEQPFWEDIDDIVSDINEIISYHYFTTYRNDMLYFPEDGIVMGEFDFSRRRVINNAGDVGVGLEIKIQAYDTVTNPIIYAENEKFFGVGYGSGNKKVVMHAGDILTITTGKDMKTVTLNGQNLLGKIKPQSTWLQLAAGENVFSVDSDDQSADNMVFSLTYRRRYV